MLTEEQGKKLLKLARDSIETWFDKTDPDISQYSGFSKKQGLFVTLKKDDELRGCIGFPEPVKQLYEAVVDAARSAAFHDPRFIPLDKKELKQIHIEISVLTVPEEIIVDKPEDYAKKIIIGEDGLIIRSTYGSGLLLPQVFIEEKCNPEKALALTCQKAGLPLDEWKTSKDIQIFKFQAQIFSEKEKGGTK